MGVIGRLLPLRGHKAIRYSQSVLLRELPYIETHLTDHCSLACRGCSHYSSIAPERYRDIAIHDRDMRRLAELFRTIRTIRLMGGEPLLHPDVADFVRSTRTSFPRSHLAVVTNGTHLAKAPPEFWSAMRWARARIDFTVYPAMAQHAEDTIRMCREEGVRVDARPVAEFVASGNLSGSSDPKEAFSRCGIGYYCRFLQEGRVYRCAMAALAGYFNERFGYEIAVDRGLDIHADGITAFGLIEELNRPVETCRWCSTERRSMEWKSGGGTAADWDVSPPFPELE